MLIRKLGTRTLIAVLVTIVFAGGACFKSRTPGEPSLQSHADGDGHDRILQLSNSHACDSNIPPCTCSSQLSSRRFVRLWRAARSRNNCADCDDFLEILGKASSPSWPRVHVLTDPQIIEVLASQRR